jgi:hypothetical protein
MSSVAETLRPLLIGMGFNENRIDAAWPCWRGMTVNRL